MALVTAYFIMLAALVIALLLLSEIGRQSPEPTSAFYIVLYLTIAAALPLICYGVYQRMLVPAVWGIRFLWRRRRRSWMLAAVIAVSLWLVAFVAIWRVDWFDDVAFVIVSHVVLRAMYESRGAIAAKLRRLSGQARG